MDRKLMIKICFVAAVVLASSSAYATSNITGALSIGGGTFAPSNNVAISLDSTATAYAAYSGHLNGDRMFFTNNADPKLYYGTKAKGSSISVTARATQTVPSGFTSM